VKGIFQGVRGNVYWKCKGIFVFLFLRKAGAMGFMPLFFSFSSPQNSSYL
jgi:hypothetical protein